MKRATENKIILVVRRTRLDELVARFNTRAQTQFYIEHQNADFSDYQQEHDNYQQAVQDSQTHLTRLGRLHVLERRFLPNFVFGDEDIVVVLGPDGLVANTVKYLNHQWVIGVNPDPQRWDGVLLPFTVADLPHVIKESFARKRAVKTVSMAKASLNNGQQLYAVNDLFIGRRTHVSARYQIRLGERAEQHSSSGIIVSTGVGSTGWFKSLLTGAQHIVSALPAGQRKRGKDKTGKPSESNVEGVNFPWDADYLYYTVREPFPSHTSNTDLAFGRIDTGQVMQLTSQMEEDGVIFSDGVEQDFLEFNAGTQAIISVAEKQGHLVI